MGHEYSVTVAAPGAGVENWREGEAVTGSFYLFCGNYLMCAAGREMLCINNRGNIGAKIDGAFAATCSELRVAGSTRKAARLWKLSADTM